MDNTDNTNADGGPGGGAGPGDPAGRGDAPQPGRVQRQLARRHRRERIAGVLIALLGVAVLIVAVLALRNPRQSPTSAGSDTHSMTRPAPSSPLTLSQRSGAPSAATSASSGRPSGSSGRPAAAEPLIVLNQTTTTGLAHQAAARFRSGGWQVTSVQEGYQNDVITTTAYYDPAIAGAERAAQALARQYPTIHRVAERFPELPAGPVVVVLTTDYTSA